MQAWRCRICGEVFLGNEKPNNCPFCGAHDQFLVMGRDFKTPEEPIKNLTGVSKKNLEASLDLEVSNTRFYLAVSKKSPSMETQSMFKGLSKVEREHASTVCKALGIEKPKELNEPSEAKEDDMENLKEADIREHRATKLYSKFLGEAEEPRVKEIFQALMQIESDHIELIGEKMK